ncbi:MAG: hypothetical protein ACRDOA_24070, partial [Streptosporangiaceae bacterium]
CWTADRLRSSAERGPGLRRRRHAPASRLDGTPPAGRLLEAKDIACGTINLRIALGGPGEVDDEVVGWLRRVYDESVAPPAPRRAALRPAPVLGTLNVLIDGFDLPGLACHPEPDGTVHRTVHVALTGRGTALPYLDLPGRGARKPSSRCPATPRRHAGRSR